MTLLDTIGDGDMEATVEAIPVTNFATTISGIVGGVSIGSKRPLA